MNRSILPIVFCLAFSPLLVTQKPLQATTETVAESAPASAGLQQLDSSHAHLLKNARMIHIRSETAFLTVSTLERALMKSKNWEKLGLSIVNDPKTADLQIDVDRLVFTHIHTYVLSDRGTSIVLASGRVRAFDGIIASGPMAEQIVKILSAARLAAQASHE